MVRQAIGEAGDLMPHEAYQMLPSPTETLTPNHDHGHEHKQGDDPKLIKTTSTTSPRVKGATGKSSISPPHYLLTLRIQSFKIVLPPRVYTLADKTGDS